LFIRGSLVSPSRETTSPAGLGHRWDTSALFRTRVAVLWVAVAIAVSGSVLLYLLVPGALEDLVAGEIEGEA
ncbi:MAG TPA: hypothetical protein VIW46_09985, partial [Acidimicrobiia bacterium]